MTEAEKHQCNLKNRIHKMVIFFLSETRTNLNSENEQSTLLFSSRTSESRTRAQKIGISVE